MNVATLKDRTISLSRNVGYQSSVEAALHPRRTETSNVPMQKAIKICVRNESCRIYNKLRGLSVASRVRLRFHSDNVSSGSVMLYASTYREAWVCVNLIVSPLKFIFIVSVHICWKFVLI